MNTRSGKQAVATAFKKTAATAFKKTAATAFMMATGWFFSVSISAAESGIRGPDVTIIAEAEKTIYEYRQGGQLRMVRVIPKWGKPYYLVPADQTTGFGDLERADTLIPSWVIVEF